MREIEGFVCTAKLTFPAKREMLFGLTTGGSDFSHQKLTSNGLVPFKDLTSALKSLEELKKRKDLGIKRIGLAVIKMKVAASVGEMEQLRENKNLVLIAELDGGNTILLGRKVGDIPGVCYAPVSDLESNGFKPISFEDATKVPFGAIYEVERQGRVVCHLATFELRRLKLK